MEKTEREKIYQKMIDLLGKKSLTAGEVAEKLQITKGQAAAWIKRAQEEDGYSFTTERRPSNGKRGAPPVAYTLA